MKGFYTIKYVSLRTKLTPHVIRAWERRYEAVVPRRSPKNRRLYAEEDIRRLDLLKALTDAGHSISRVARLDTAELSDMARREKQAGTNLFYGSERPPQQLASQDYRDHCLAAVVNLEPDRLERIYDQAAVDLSRSGLIKEVVVPLFEAVGDLWRDGSLKILNEHMATSVTRTFLMNMVRSTAISDSAPRIVIATTAGQWHDTGALAVAVMAAEYGWRPLYFGPDLPAEEIAAAVKHCGARAVAVSVTHALQQVSLAEELRKLRRYIGDSVGFFVGGRAVGAYAKILEELNAVYIESIDHLGDALTSFLGLPPPNESDDGKRRNHFTPNA
jgi:DNA-binding transcriptional MerR regulator/methylmalonyl-CoA mutase cobalamin-binding subunit